MSRQRDRSGATLSDTEIVSDAQRASQFLCSEAVRNYKSGFGAKYEDSLQGLQEFREATERYFDYVYHTNLGIEDGQPVLVLDIEGWCIAVGISRMTLSSYRKRGEAWKEYVDFIKDAILADKKARASSGKMPPVLFIFDAVNNFNYKNASEAGNIKDNLIENKSVVEYPKLSLEERED